MMSAPESLKYTTFRFLTVVKCSRICVRSSVPEHHEVLHHLFAQVVVYAVDRSSTLLHSEYRTLLIPLRFRLVSCVASLTPPSSSDWNTCGHSAGQRLKLRCFGLFPSRARFRDKESSQDRGSCSASRSPRWPKLWANEGAAGQCAGFGPGIDTRKTLRRFGT